MNAEQKNVIIECPVCSATKKIPIPSDAIVRTEGLTTLNIPANIVCPHTFQIYLDQQFHVRGYLSF